MKPENSQTARRVAAIKQALAHKPMNAHEIAAAIGMCVPRAEDYLVMMKDRSEIHIKCWKPPSAGKQQRIAHYKLGKGRNAPKPKPYTPAERMALRRERVRQDEELYLVSLDKGRTHKRIRRVLKQQQGWASAVGIQP